MQYNKIYSVESPFKQHETIYNKQEKLIDQVSKLYDPHILSESLVHQLQNQYQIYDSINQPQNYNQLNRYVSSKTGLQLKNNDLSKNNQEQQKPNYHESNELNHDSEQQINLQEQYDQQYQQDQTNNFKNQESQENRDIHHKYETQFLPEQYGIIIEIGISNTQDEEELITDKNNPQYFCSNTQSKFQMNNLYLPISNRNRKIFQILFKAIRQLRNGLNSIEGLQYNQKCNIYCIQNQIILIVSDYLEQIFNFYYINDYEAIKFKFSLKQFLNYKKKKNLNQLRYIKRFRRIDVQKIKQIRILRMINIKQLINKNRISFLCSQFLIMIDSLKTYIQRVLIYSEGRFADNLDLSVFKNLTVLPDNNYFRYQMIAE